MASCEKCLHYEVCDRSSHLIWDEIYKKECSDFMGWIPVTEHEPEIDCLTVDDLGQIVLAKRISVITLPTKQKIYLANDKAEEILACLGDGDTLINCTHITHWMPLPEPTKE